MKNNFVAQHLNVEAFAAAAGHLVGDEPYAAFPRLLTEAQGACADLRVSYSARGELRQDAQPDEQQVWLHLAALAVVPLTCQRCLEPVNVPVSVDRSFRLVDNEALAATLDEESEEDVLVLSSDFDLLSLIEDELLLSLPLVPKHDVCPIPVKSQVADPDFIDIPEEKRNPFAALEQLKKKPSP